MKWISVVEMDFEIELLEGARIGGSGGSLDIGGVDANLQVLKNPINGEPYLPGSSIKGKLRSTLEKEYGLGEKGKPCGCVSMACPVCPIFGAHMNMSAPSNPSRLTVRDSMFTDKYRSEWKERRREGEPVLETKTENTIDRIRGAAHDPRTGERVLPGATFKAQIILRIFEGDNKDKMVEHIKHALAVVQRFDSLGAAGSRGSGRIKVNNFNSNEVSLSSVSL